MVYSGRAEVFLRQNLYRAQETHLTLRMNSPGNVIAYEGITVAINGTLLCTVF